ncbi:hypothetical protein [uncultured Chryseobacterium sp.]|uniref:hypothetical protein n=1 Tax=uncultured Chryseobacterium sp. TaxID=259322 RepID=UPI0025E4F155|nr:hypothetical protein [uncultured Chryseobacterium sp.]
MIKEQYGLEFYKLSSDGSTSYHCRRKEGIVDQNNSLQFLSYLDRAGTEYLLREVNLFLNTDDPDRSMYESMVLEHIELDIEYPDFRIDKLPYTFPLADIEDLLQEWLDFLQA